METELTIPTSLFAPPKKDPVSLYQSQIGFMNIFAIPLFQGVADIMPSLKYTVNELETNKALFEDKIAAAVEHSRRSRWSQEAFSPRTLSLAVDSDVAPLVNSSLTLKQTLQEDSTDASSGPTNSFETPRATEPGNDAEMNGCSSFDAVSQFAASDTFSCQDDHLLASDKQRCSETTEGSTSVPGGDWASQATSATTGKMPLSPSTQGTSIVSRESIDRHTSIPVTTVTSPDNKVITEPQYVESRSIIDEDSNASSNDLPSPQPRRLLKKKSSLFKINLNFFKRHRNPSSSVPAIPALPQNHVQTPESAG